MAQPPVHKLGLTSGWLVLAVEYFQVYFFISGLIETLTEQWNSSAKTPILEDNYWLSVKPSVVSLLAATLF